MVSKSKSNTPVSINPDHPANSLSYGNDEQISALLKLQPIYMPTDKHANQDTLDKVRSSYKYLYVINWLYQCRGYVKLQSEYFDIDLFEIELLNMVYPPPVDESILFINKLKLALISTVQNSKCSSLNNFEKIFRLWFGVETPLGGNEDEDDINPEPKFDDLLMEDKFEILFILISYITQYQNFRNYLDKNNVSSDVTRILPVYSEVVKQGTTEEYILLFDNTRLYKRIITFPELTIPKKRKLAPEFPEEFFDPEKFDIESTTFEIISKNIYDLNSFLLDIYTKRKQKKFKILYSNLADEDVFESIFNAEIKKRKILTNRRKELQLANLLATRKRSSRLEAKEKQRQEELRLLKLQEEEELKVAAEKRLERRRMVKDQISNTNSVSTNSSTLSREERLKLRKITAESSKNTASPEFESQAINIKQENTPTAGHNEDHNPNSNVIHNSSEMGINMLNIDRSENDISKLPATQDPNAISTHSHILNSINDGLVPHSETEQSFHGQANEISYGSSNLPSIPVQNYPGNFVQTYNSIQQNLHIQPFDKIQNPLIQSITPALNSTIYQDGQQFPSPPTKQTNTFNANIGQPTHGNQSTYSQSVQSVSDVNLIQDPNLSAYVQHNNKVNDSSATENINN